MSEQRVGWAVVCSCLVLGGVAMGQPSGGSAPAAGAAAPSGAAMPAPTPGWNERARAFGGFEWVTRPSRDSAMGFTIPMEVYEIPVVAGQVVKKGQLLIRGRDTEALAALEVQRVRATNRAPIDNAVASLDLAEIRLRDGEEAIRNNALNQAELDERRAQVASSRAQLDNAKAQVAEEQARLVQMDRQLERYRLEAPFDGVVELVAAEVGQTFEQAQPMVRIVSVDPVWIDVPASTEETLAGGLKAGDKAWVLLDVPPDTSRPQGEIIEGKVLDVSRVVDASGSRRVRVEAPNTRQWPAGIRARVRFSPPGEARVAERR